MILFFELRLVAFGIGSLCLLSISKSTQCYCRPSPPATLAPRLSISSLRDPSCLVETYFYKSHGASALAASLTAHEQIIGTTHNHDGISAAQARHINRGYVTFKCGNRKEPPGFRHRDNDVKLTGVNNSAIRHRPRRSQSTYEPTV